MKNQAFQDPCAPRKHEYKSIRIWGNERVIELECSLCKDRAYEDMSDSQIYQHRNHLDKLLFDLRT